MRIYQCSRRLVVATVILATGLIADAAAPGAGDDTRETHPQRPSSAAREDHVAVIVNLSNPVTDLSLKELRGIVMLQRTQWPNGRKITVALYEPGYPEREVILRRVYGMTEAGFTRYFLHATFTGQISSGPRQLATSEGVRRYVVNVPGAVGFIRLHDVDTSVKTVHVDGQTAGAPDYSLTMLADLEP